MRVMQVVSKKRVKNLESLQRHDSRGQPTFLVLPNAARLQGSPAELSILRILELQNSIPNVR